MPSRDLIPFDPADPLRRIPRVEWYPGETAASSRALHDYAAMGTRRSLDALLAKYLVQSADSAQTEKPPTVHRTTLAGWSFRFSWVIRTARHDELEDARRINADREMWLARQAEVREADWDQGDKLRKLVDEMLAVAGKYVVKSRSFSEGTPTVVDKKGKIISKGKPDIQTLNIALDASFLTRAAKLGMDMQRLAAGEPTENIKVSDWRSDLVALLKSGTIQPEDVTREFGDDIAKQLCATAGLSPGSEGGQS